MDEFHTSSVGVVKRIDEMGKVLCEGGFVFPFNFASFLASCMLFSLRRRIFWRTERWEDLF